MRHLGCQRELGIVGEFEVVAAGMTADDPALLQGDDDLRVEVPVTLGEGAWIAGNDVEDFGGLGAQRRPEAAEPVQRDALAAGEIAVVGAQAADGRARGGGGGVDADPGTGQLPGEGGHCGTTRGCHWKRHEMSADGATKMSVLGTG